MARKFTRKDKINYLKKFLQYVDENEYPIIAEFAHLNNILRESLYEWAKDLKLCTEYADVNSCGFDYALKKAINKKESYLERNLLENKVNTPGAIFALKQVGWKDQPEREIPVSVNVNIDKVLKADADKLEHGVQDMLQSVKIDNNRKRKPVSQKN